jgi:LmbE family N-acetylglucosaminyl deacetylase
MMSGKRILVITAHADDAEFFAGGTLAKFAEEGAVIEEIITTDNGRGSFELDAVTLVEQSRKVEAEAAARVLGKSAIQFLGYPDGFLGDTPINELREIFMRHIRRFKPDILFTFDPWAPFESHPDHRQVAMAAIEAVGFAHLPLYHPEHKEEGLKPHMTAENYLFAKNSQYCNTIVDIGQTIDKKIEALCAHDSQMRMTIDDLKMSVERMGRFTGFLPMLDRDNYRPALEMMIRTWAQSVAAEKEFEFGEEFRHECVDDLLAAATEE